MRPESIVVTLALCIVSAACDITERDILPATPQESEAIIPDKYATMDFVRTDKGEMYDGMYGYIDFHGWTVLLDTGRMFTRQWLDSLESGIRLLEKTHAHLPLRYRELRARTIIAFVGPNALPADTHVNRISGSSENVYIIRFHLPLMREKFLHEIGHVYDFSHSGTIERWKAIQARYQAGKVIWQNEEGDSRHAAKNSLEYVAWMYMLHFTKPDYLRAKDIGGYEMIADLEEWHY